MAIKLAPECQPVARLTPPPASPFLAGPTFLQMQGLSLSTVSCSTSDGTVTALDSCAARRKQGSTGVGATSERASRRELKSSFAADTIRRRARTTIARLQPSSLLKPDRRTALFVRFGARLLHSGSRCLHTRRRRHRAALVGRYPPKNIRRLNAYARPVKPTHTLLPPPPHARRVPLRSRSHRTRPHRRTNPMPAALLCAPRHALARPAAPPPAQPSSS